jgi:hypothetical protein
MYIKKYPVSSDHRSKNTEFIKIKVRIKNSLKFLRDYCKHSVSGPAPRAIPDRGAGALKSLTQVSQFCHPESNARRRF